MTHGPRQAETCCLASKVFTIASTSKRHPPTCLRPPVATLPKAACQMEDPRPPSPASPAIPPRSKPPARCRSELDQVLTSDTHPWFVGKMTPAERDTCKKAAEKFKKRYAHDRRSIETVLAIAVLHLEAITALVINFLIPQ